MSDLYTVIFSGRLLPGVDAQQAAREFSQTFKVPEEKARQLIAAGQEKTLKQEVTLASAERYCEVLTDIGFEVRVVPLATVTAPPPIPLNMDKSPSAAPRPMAREASIPLRTVPASVPIGHGWLWIVRGFEAFRRAPGFWIGAALILMCINILLSLVPLFGGVMSTLISPVLIGGLMLGMRDQQQGIKLRIEHLFAGFSHQTGNLAAIGGLYLLASLAIGIVVAVIGMLLVVGSTGLNSVELYELMHQLEQNPEAIISQLAPVMLFLLLLIFGLLVPLLMAYWFAPALVALDQLGPLTAMGLSFKGCLRNLSPFLLYGLVSTVLMIVAMIPFFLGLVVFVPVIIASIHAAYQDIFQHSVA